MRGKCGGGEGRPARAAVPPRAVPIRAAVPAAAVRRSSVRPCVDSKLHGTHISWRSAGRDIIESEQDLIPGMARAVPRRAVPILF